ncbi:right-handed parallel beta-helix repeat-containing protein, partial [Cronobacter sakazakii]
YSLIGSASYSDIRAYSGTATNPITCYGRLNPYDHAYGSFYCDLSDTTSPDDDGTVLVDALGRRWKRKIAGEVYPDWWGAVADNSTDCSPAFQKAIDFCSGKNIPANRAGLNLRIRGGRYVLMSGLVYTWRFDSGVVDDGDMRRFTMEGDATGNTYLIYKGPSTTPALSIKGGTGGGVYLRMELKNFRLWRSLELTRYLGVGISIIRGAMFSFSNVDLGLFNTGFIMEDTLYCTFRNCDLSGNNQGVSMKLTSFSSPNSILFDRCSFGGCLIRGAYIINGSNVEFRGCTFEGIGTDGTGEAILYQGGQHEGGLGLFLSSCYFENNYVQYDVNISNGTAYSGTHILQGCSFNRPSLARAPTGGSVNLFSNTAEMRVNLTGNAFKGYNDYTPSSSRPAYIVQSDKVYVTEASNYYQNSVERPVTNSVPVLGNGLGTLACVANISSVGVLVNGWNVQSVTKTGTGAYTVTFKKPIYGAVVGVANISGGIGVATISAANTTSVQVITHDQTFVQADKAFNMIVMGQI